MEEILCHFSPFSNCQVTSFPVLLPVQPFNKTRSRYVKIWKRGLRCWKIHQQNDDPARNQEINKALESYKRFMNDIVISKYLGLVDSFLEAAPQATFQLYLLMKEDDSWPSKISDTQIILQCLDVLFRSYDS